MPLNLRGREVSVGAYIQRITTFIRGGIIVYVTLATTTIATYVIPPSETCKSCFSFGALTYLFDILTIIYTLGGIHFFCLVTDGMIRLFGGTHVDILTLICVAFVNSVLVTGSVTLLAFLPLNCCILSAASGQRCVTFAFVVRALTTGLNNVLAPFNGPRGLFLCAGCYVPSKRFLTVVLPPFLVSVALVALYYIIFIGPRPLQLPDRQIRLPVGQIVFCLFLFTVTVLVIFHNMPCLLNAKLIFISVFFTSHGTLGQISCNLLLAFIFFFVFTNGVTHVPTIQRLFSFLLDGDALLFDITSYRIVDGIPSTVLLSRFASGCTSLLIKIGVNNINALISSLTDLVALQRCSRHGPNGAKQCVLLFSTFGNSFLVLLATVVLIVH